MLHCTIRPRIRLTQVLQSWKPIHLVLRPHNLSIYADSDGTKLRHVIQLSEVTAVARQRDPKKKERHVFALFTSERNYHIEAKSETEAQQWVEMIRSQARIDEEEDEIIALMSPTLERPPGMDSGFFGKSTSSAPIGHAGETSASDLDVAPMQVRKSRSRNNLGTTPENMHSAQRKSSVGLSYLSSAEQASYSDFSDNGGHYPESTLSLPHQTQAEKEERARKVDEIYQPSATHAERPTAKRSTSAISARAIQTPQDNERVVYNGYLYMLKSKRGMRQWKSVWAVLRGRSLALYKNEEEYKPLYIINFANIVDAVDVDNLSKSKRHCFQVITDERQFKFCAPGEDEVAKWVGGFKALLAKRREAGKAKDEDKKVQAETLAPPR